MATLQEIRGSIENIHKSLEQGKTFLLGNAATCKQYVDLVRAGIEGTAYAEYNQVLSLLQASIDAINKTALTLNSVESTLEQWARLRGGLLLGGISPPGPLPVEDTAPVETLDSMTGDLPHKTLSPEAVNARWESIVQTTNEVIDNYRSALMARGIPGGKLLEKFLQSERTKILNYEAAVLNQASGHGEVSGDNRYIYRIAGATGEYGYDSLANEYGQFCLNDATKWIADINPNYYSPFILPKNNPYRVNCGSCAFAVDARLSGSDDLIASRTNISTDYAMEVATGKKCVYMPIEHIEDYLRNQGPGSHLIVGINRGPTPDGYSQSGHWFNAFFDGENFYTIDGQCGKILEWPYDYGCVTEWCALI